MTNFVDSAFDCDGIILDRRLSRLRRALLAGVATSALLLGASLASASSARAQAVAAGFNQTALPRNDDASSAAVTLPFTANFFGTSYSQLYVNNNGNVTFGAASSDFSPVGLGAGYRGAPIIAPFFADVDTRNPASGVTAYGTGTNAGRATFGVTWPAVGYFASRADKTNTFQVLLTERSDTGAGNFDITYNYNRIQFESGEADGGVNGLGGASASAGFSAGTGAAGAFYEFPGSLVNGALIDGGPNALATTSNNGVPGQFLFPVRNGAVLLASVCSAGDNASTTTLANCGPNRAYASGIFYTPTTGLTLNVLQGATITAATNQDAILVMPTEIGGIPVRNDVVVNVDASARIAAPAGVGVRIDTRNGIGSAAINNSGAVSAGVAGLATRTLVGDVTILNAGAVTAPVGIAAASSSGAVSVTNRGAITGNIGAAAGSARAVTIANEAAGRITFGQYGIVAASAAGPLAITNAGMIAQDAALLAPITTAQRSVIPAAFAELNPGAAAGIFAADLGAGLTIANSGTISVPGARAIDATASVAPAQVVNSGTITGALALNARSVVTNAATGVFNATGASGFGGGGFTNSGLVALGADATLNALSGFTNAGGAVRLAGASGGIAAATFTNAGTIDLQNGRAGDVLTITGNYVGQNGRLGLDVSTQGGVSDRLVIAGNASGSTGLSLVNVTPGAAFTASPVLVQVTGQASADAFTLASAQNFGALEVALATSQSANGGSAVTLVTIPNAVGQSGPTAVIAARTIAFQGSAAVLDRVTQARGDAQRSANGQPAIPQALQYAGLTQYSALVSKDPISPNLAPPAPASNVKPAVWARAFGDLERRTGFGAVAFGGVATTRDLGYDQSTGGVMAGADVVISGLTTPDDGLILGVLGGYSVAAVKLNQGAGRQDYDGGSVGAYATYLKGAFFADALFKVDLLGLDITAPSLRQRTGLQNYSVLGNIGYRFDIANSLYIEPTAGLEYVATRFDSNPGLTATTVPLVNGDALRGRIGARLGTEFVQDRIRVEPSITGLVYDVFTESGNTAAFGGVTSVTGLTNVGKVRGEIQASISFLNLETGLSGFLRADYRIGGDLVGGGGRAGIRYQW